MLIAKNRKIPFIEANKSILATCLLEMWCRKPSKWLKNGSYNRLFQKVRKYFSGYLVFMKNIYYLCAPVNMRVIGLQNKL